MQGVQHEMVQIQNTKTTGDPAIADAFGLKAEFCEDNPYSGVGAEAAVGGAGASVDAACADPLNLPSCVVASSLPKCMILDTAEYSPSAVQAGRLRCGGPCTSRPRCRPYF